MNVSVRGMCAIAKRRWYGALIEELLKPCIKVVHGGRSYRVVLRKIIELWVGEKLWERGEGVCFHRLKMALQDEKYKFKKENTVVGDATIKSALGVLTDCGYLVCREGRAKTNSPWGRKDYVPTPLGVSMNLILTLLYPEETTAPNLHESFAVYFTFIAQEVFFDILPYMFHLTILLTSPQPSKIPLLAKGWLTAEYAADLVAVRLATKVDWNIFPHAFLRIPLVQDKLWDVVESEMYERLKRLEDLKKRGVEELVEVLSEVYKSAGLELPVGVKDLFSQAIKHLHENFEALCRSISAYGDIRLKTYGRLRPFKLESY